MTGRQRRIASRRRPGRGGYFFLLFLPFLLFFATRITHFPTRQVNGLLTEGQHIIDPCPLSNRL
jgi:hypothetical protein